MQGVALAIMAATSEQPTFVQNLSSGCPYTIRSP
jgi:hypothetical protein